MAIVRLPTKDAQFLEEEYIECLDDDYVSQINKDFCPEWLLRSEALVLIGSEEEVPVKDFDPALVDEEHLPLEALTNEALRERVKREGAVWTYLENYYTNGVVILWVGWPLEEVQKVVNEAEASVRTDGAMNVILQAVARIYQYQTKERATELVEKACGSGVRLFQERVVKSVIEE